LSRPFACGLLRCFRYNVATLNLRPVNGMQKSEAPASLPVRLRSIRRSRM
jgi:hypothetical protein